MQRGPDGEARIETPHPMRVCGRSHANEVSSVHFTDHPHGGLFGGFLETQTLLQPLPQSFHRRFVHGARVAYVTLTSLHLHINNFNQQYQPT